MNGKLGRSSVQTRREEREFPGTGGRVSLRNKQASFVWRINDHFVIAVGVFIGRIENEPALKGRQNERLVFVRVVDYVNGSEIAKNDPLAPLIGDGVLKGYGCRLVIGRDDVKRLVDQLSRTRMDWFGNDHLYTQNCFPL